MKRGGVAITSSMGFSDVDSIHSSGNTKTTEMMISAA